MDFQNQQDVACQHRDNNRSGSDVSGRNVMVVAAGLLFALLSGFQATAAVVIANSGFESPAETNTYIGSDWTLAGGGVRSALGDPYLNGTAPYESSRAASLTANSTITQSITGFAVGGTYQLSYWEEGRYVNDVPGWESIAHGFATIGGLSIVAEHDVKHTGAFVQVTSSPFTATAETMNLVLGSYATAYDSALNYDAVSVSVVPEPSAMVLLAMGLAGLCPAWRKRR